MKMIISGVVIAVGIGIVIFLTTKERPQSDIPSSVISTEASLMVSAQNATSTVNIDSVTLPQAGFLAVRSVDNGRLGQIIEISQYLSAGAHKNVEIPLGDFYEGGKELIVMAYEDAGDDKIFNDFDQPLETGNMPLSVYVATGASVPSSITTNTGSADAIHTMGNSTMATVRYTDSGFEPKDLSVPLGTTVHFVNESIDDMWVASNEHPGHTDLSTFDQFGFGKTGEQYMYTFDQAGAWRYHDHLNPTAEGVIIVE